MAIKSANMQLQMQQQARKYLKPQYKNGASSSCGGDILMAK